ncbi:CAAX prenyl protease, partial [Teratosphaeriaceae sp. CCFEE 6253]
SRTPPGRRLPPLPVWISGILRSLFQLTYTSLFGFFAAFVYLRTGNIWAVILAHSFCNWMGIPRVWGRVGQFAADYEDITPDVAQGKRDEGSDGAVKMGNSLMQGRDEDEAKTAQARSVGPANVGVGWTVIYYVLIFAGAFGFYKMLWPLTESRNALAVFT